MDISETLAPKSDQLNADDLLSGPRTVTITGVRAGTPEQPVEIVLDEYGPGRPFKPSKTVRRILVSAWTAEASTYVGHRMTIYNDPLVRFGGVPTGGIRVSHLSHIDGPLTLAVTVSRGKRAPVVVQPLPAERAWLSELEDAGNDPDLIRALGTAAKNAHAPADVMAALTQAYNAAKDATDG